MTPLEAFAGEVYRNPDLQRRLAAFTEPVAFVAAVVAEADAMGVKVSRVDVEDALREARAEERERWV